MADPALDVVETTVSAIRSAYSSGALSCVQLVQQYLQRIEAYDQAGPSVNCLINLNPEVEAQAAALDAQRGAGAPVGPLHGIPVIVKDQVDAVGMPTTLGSVLFADYRPDRDATVVSRLKAAGALVLAKATLGEFGAGDTHGSLFGSTRNPYDLARTVGGSSGGSAAGLAANFAPLAVGQEGFASISRPAAWNSVVGMRPSFGLVSRAGVFGGWPSTSGSLGPMARTVADAALLLDVMVGYDPEDPATALAVRRVPGWRGPLGSSSGLAGGDGLVGVRVGVLRQCMGLGSEPQSDDFAAVTEVFDQAVGDIRSAGAVVVDHVPLPRLEELLGRRAFTGAAEALAGWLGRSREAPFASHAELVGHPRYVESRQWRSGGRPPVFAGNSYPEYLAAREELRLAVFAEMARQGLDVIVHKSVEHTPTLIADGLRPPFVDQRGAVQLNTFLGDFPSISVPAGFTSDGLPVGVSFLGRPFTDAALLRHAHAYEQATRHRRPPSSTP